MSWGLREYPYPYFFISIHLTKEISYANSPRDTQTKRIGSRSSGLYRAFPQYAHAAFNKTAFEAKNVADALKALGAGAPVESKDVTITGPDIAENGAVVPWASARRSQASNRC